MKNSNGVAKGKGKTLEALVREAAKKRLEHMARGINR